MSNMSETHGATVEELTGRLAGLARSKSRLELINRLLISLSPVSGLDNMVERILNILMQTIGAANISIYYRLDGCWQFRDIYGATRRLQEPDDPDVVMALEGGDALRVHGPLMQAPYPGVSGSVPVEDWVFPLLSHERRVGAVCMEGMQLIDQGIIDDLQPFFIYAGLMLDNEISNYSQLAEAHRRLQDSETLYRTLFDQSPDGIVLWSVPDLRSVQFNTAAHAMLGYSREEFGSLTVTDLDASLGAADIDDRLEAMCREGAAGFESVHCTRTGEPLSMFISLKMLELGGRRMILAIHRDISAVKSAEEERDRLERQLLHTQKLESLGVLAGGIAHDFNNILTSIIGNADLALIRINRESPAVENLRRIEQAASQAADLARQMLAYSGKGRFVIENLDMNRLLEEMLHMLEVSISKKAVLRFNLTKNLPSVEADATQMRQIIMNLVINASEAIGDKSGVIAITTGCMDCDRSYLKDVWLDENLSDGLYVYLEIADSGCGMDRETMTKLFDPFFTTKFTGRGLGMAAVLGIVRGHRGAIKVYSEPGRGSSFKILLPASGRPAELFNGSAAQDHWRGIGTVLLVDDEETVRGIGGEMLRELGFEVVTANDGRDALEIFRERNDINFVILDLTMPHMDGEQCFRELRRLNPDVKVIMSSGYNEQEVTRKFVGKGLAGFIQKPYKLSVLKEAIIKVDMQSQTGGTR
ncbi:MAG: response regulator [Geobacteraceae bacterium]|nr:response regulator [Geobacteraceae bacterium]